MRIVCLILYSVFLIFPIESTRLKICIPKKKNSKDIEGAEISFENTLNKLRQQNDKIFINGTKSIHLNLEGVISGDVDVTNVSITGIRNITICIFPSIFDLATITINNLTIEGVNYNLNAEISDLFDLYGNGKFLLNLEGMTIKATKWYFLLRCVYLEVEMKLQKMKANFENILDGDAELQRVINAVMGDLGPDAVDYYWKEIYTVIEPIIQKIIDKYINKVELENFLTVLSSGNDIFQKSKKKSCFDLN